MTGRVALLVDGDNIGAQHARTIFGTASKLGSLDIARVFGDATHASGWLTAAGYRFVHAGCGKNATDVLLAIDAMELALCGGIGTVAIASSDGDFSHLAHRLRERGLMVLGIGEAKATPQYRAACTRFEVLPPSATAAQPCAAPSLDQKIRTVIATNSSNGKGMRIADLSPKMKTLHGVQISTLPEKKWRTYLSARPALYELDPRGPDAHVRFKARGFADLG
jgi:uncharacterized protein (TIGR00288 family)